VAKRRTKGEGSIFTEKATGYWCAEITLPDGMKKRKRSKKQQIVREWLLEQRQAIQDGLTLTDGNSRYDKYLDRYLFEVAIPSLRPKTVDAYKWLIDSHIKPNLGHLALNKIKPEHLQSLYSRKQEEGLSKRTVQHMHAVIRVSLNQALKWGIIARNPATLVRAPTPNKRESITLTKEQAALYLESVEDHRWYPIYVLAITTGMRKGEILGLRWRDIDFERHNLSIRHTVQYLRGHNISGETKTPSSRRMIALSGYTISVLRMHQTSSNGSEGLVFSTSTGKPISGRNITRHFHRSLEKAGLERMPFQDLRHTAATLLLKENVHPKIVQDMLGHSSITLTLDTYSHILPDMQQEAAEKMDGIFGKV